MIVVLIGLGVVNAVVLDNQTKPAEVTADGGRIEHVSSVDLQVFDSPATGSGPEGAPIVLLHCFGCSSQWWNPILPALNENHRVIRIDLIGHGGSEKPQSGYEIDSQGAAVAEALNSLGVQGATVVGHSLGGMVATALATTASELVDRIVLIGTPSEPDESSLPFTEKVIHVPVIGQATWRLRVDAMIKSGYQSAFAPGVDVSDVFPGDPDRVVDDNRAMTYDSFTKASDEATSYLEQQSLASRLAATGVPLMFIDGSEDQIIDASVGSGGVPRGPRRDHEGDRRGRALAHGRVARRDGQADPRLRRGRGARRAGILRPGGEADREAGASAIGRAAVADGPIRIVVLEGDQTGQELLEAALTVIDPAVVGLELELERFDLSLEHRGGPRTRLHRGRGGDARRRARAEGGDDHAGGSRRRRQPEPVDPRGDRRDRDRPDRPADPRRHPDRRRPSPDLDLPDGRRRRLRSRAVARAEPGRR